MKYRINTGNTDCGQESILGPKDWKRFLLLHWQGADKLEVMQQFGHIENARKAIEKIFKQ